MTLLQEPQVAVREPSVDQFPASPPVAHQYQSAQHQQGAARLGMWLFLGTEVLLFSGLLCIYAVVRSAHPEVFAWGQRMLDPALGGLNTLILIGSSLTMAWAVRAAQMNQRRLVMVLLALTLLGGAGFLGIKCIEYDAKIHYGLLPGDKFRPNLRYAAVHSGVSRKELRQMIRAQKEALAAAPVLNQVHPGDPAAGQPVFDGTCAGCHGRTGAGLPGQGANLRTSKFVAERDEEQLLAFVRVGRLPTDPQSVLKLAMPARGGNPALTDQSLRDAIAYLKKLQQEELTAPSAPSAPAAAAKAPVADAGPNPADGPRTSIPASPEGPAGLATDAPPAARRAPVLSDFAPPANTQLYFSVYFLLTGLHGLHVLAGMGLISWLLWRTYRGDFSHRYYTPLDLGGMYWHLVDMVWIFLFPLLYLIR